MTKPRVPAEIFFLDTSSHLPLQAQIREAVISAILSHQISRDDRLPSSRKLAAHLGVARLTVTQAFQELVSQGYLLAQARSAYVVADAFEEANPKAPQNIPSYVKKADWHRILHSRLDARQRVKKPINWREFKYPFVYGQIDEKFFNHAAWRDCARQAMGQKDFNSMAGDLAVADDPVLVNYIRTRTLPRRGITAKNEEILITVGAQNALWLTIELLTRSPLKAVCENPGYPDTRQALRWCGAQVDLVDVDADGLPPDNIPDDVSAVFVTPSHHAPTGVTMPKARRSALLAKADAQDFVIIEDDYEFEMSYLKPASRALKASDVSDRVIYVGSFSKALFPGLRIGYLVGPADFIAEARQLRSMILRHPPGHLQRTTAYFLAQGHYDLLIRDMRKRFAERRTILQSALDNHGFEVAGACSFGGSSLWVRGPQELDATRLNHELAQDSILIEPGGAFFTENQTQANFFRLGYSSIPAERIDVAIDLLERRMTSYLAG